MNTGAGGHWARLTPLSAVLAPIAMLYCGLVVLRRLVWRRGWRRAERLAVPVIVVGNITVGGTGKTPLVLWLAAFLCAHGRRPGIVTRGYRGRSRTWPRLVGANSDPDEVGDEAVLLAQQGGCPVVAGPDRAAAGRRLLAENDCDVILSDDGLQHYRLHRDIEIAVVDGERRFGNGLCLPAGPLREPVRRLRGVDLIIAHGTPQPGELGMRMQVTAIRALADPAEQAQPRDFAWAPVHAVAGIGYPPRFFAALRAAGLTVVEHPFPDHHRFRREDLEFGDAAPVFMTAKDAVKCRAFARPGLWVVEIEAQPDPAVGDRVLQLLKETRRG